MNQFALRMFVRSIIAEAKENKDKEPSKKEAGLPKSSGKLVDLKKELAALKQMKDELQAAKFAEKTASTEVEFANLAKFAKELDKIKAGGVALEASIDEQIKALEDKISAEKNKIKEMIGLVPEGGQKKIVDENIGGKNFMYKDSTGKDKFVTADNIDQAKEKVKKFGADPKTVKEKSAALPVAPKKNK
jgi:vacuolar-type H+-ATPase subunit I/STV1